MEHDGTHVLRLALHQIIHRIMEGIRRNVKTVGYVPAFMVIIADVYNEERPFLAIRFRIGDYSWRFGLEKFLQSLEEK